MDEKCRDRKSVNEKYANETMLRQKFRTKCKVETYMNEKIRGRKNVRKCMMKNRRDEKMCEQNIEWMKKGVDENKRERKITRRRNAYTKKCTCKKIRER